MATNSDTTDEPEKEALPSNVIGFDGQERMGGGESDVGGLTACPRCGVPLHEHARQRNYEDHPPNQFSYDYICP